MKRLTTKNQASFVTLLMALFLHLTVNGQTQNTVNNVLWLVEPQFDLAWNFSEGMAAVKKDGKLGFVNKEGKYVIEPQFYFGYDFSEGMALVYKDGKWGFVNKEGKIVIEPQFDWAGNFSEGMAAVKKDGKWGFVNKEGKYVIEPHFDRAWNFSEGMAVVKKDGKWGFVNKEGEKVIEPQFDEVYDFSEGMAVVKKDGKWGYIKNPLTAKEIIQHYEYAGAFIGTIHSIAGNEVIVAGKIAEKVKIFDKLCTFSGEKMIILNAHFPMMTTAKCKVISGSIKDLKPGMKVYKYSSAKDEKKDQEKEEKQGK